MLYEDRTKMVIVESVLRLRDKLQKLDNAKVARIRQLLDNTNPPNLPQDMSGDLQTEYRGEWIGVGLARVIVNKLQSAMYGRTLSHVIEGQEKNEQLIKIMGAWRRAAPGIYSKCVSFGYSVTRFFPDKRKGVIYGSYAPDEVTPIFDSATEDLDPKGLIYHYKMDIESFPLPVPQGVKEILVVERITVHNRDRITGEIVNPGQRLRWYSFDASKWHEWKYSDDDMGLNPYGDHLGAVVWRNDDSLDGPWGMSDVLPVDTILQAISGTCTDLKLLLKWNVWPTRYSTSPGFADLPYGWRQSLELVTDGSGNSPTVGQIEMDPSSLESGMKFLKLLLQLMHEQTSVPAIAMGDLEGLGNLSSGRALEVVMLPLSDLTLRRQKLQEYQEQQAVYEILAVLAHAAAERKEKDILGIMTVKYEGMTFPYAYDIPVSVSFGQLGLSASSEDTVAYYTGLYASGLKSLYECTKGLNPEWDEEQVLKEMDRIKASTDSREGTVVDDARAARIQNLITDTEQ